MSTTEQSLDERVLEQPSKLFARTFESEIVEGDGRTLIARIVPYGVTATVADPPDFVPYDEQFDHGAFERQTRAFDRVRVWLNFEHEKGLRGIVGHGAQLEEQSDALYGHFRIHANADGDKALQLVDEGVLTGLSLEFAALRSRLIGGVMHRLRAHVDAVSLCRFPAYAGAAVLGVREQPEPDPDPPDPEPEPDDDPADDDPAEDVEGDAVPPPPAPEAVRGTIPYPEQLDERLRALSIETLARIATTSASWDGSPSRFTDEQYVRSTLFCRDGSDPPKERCSLPVLEPNGTLNTNALGAAAAALAGARGGVRNVSSAQRSAAARKLVRYYRTAGMEPPASLLAIARG